MNTNLNSLKLQTGYTLQVNSVQALNYISQVTKKLHISNTTWYTAIHQPREPHATRWLHFRSYQCARTKLLFPGNTEDTYY